MRRTSPSNRIAAYYRDPSDVAYVVTPPAGAPKWGRPRTGIATVHRLGGPAAGIVACLLQLLASMLCLGAAVLSLLGYSIAISPITAVLLGGVVFGATSGLLLYSFLVSAAVASADRRVASSTGGAI